MISTLMWAALAGGELLLVLFFALLISWFRNRAMRRRDRKAIKALIAQSKDRKEQRMAEIGEFLAGRYAMRGDVLGHAVRDIYKAETGLAQAFANTYLQRDAKAAAGFLRRIEDGVAGYWTLSPAMAGEQGVSAGDAGEVEFLRKENQELSAELRITMDTLSRMLNEYSTVFTKDADLGDIQVIGGESDADADQAVGPSSQPESFDEADMSAEGAESGVEPVAAGDTPSENRDAMFQDVTGAVANAVDHVVGTASAVGAVDAVDETLSKEDTDLSDDAAIIEQLVEMQDKDLAADDEQLGADITADGVDSRPA